MKLKKPIDMTEMPQVPNVHPVDELQAVREEMKQLQARADELRDSLLAKDADLHGNQYSARLIPSKRETVDQKALIEAFGEAAIAPYIKTTQYTTVKIVEN